MQQPHQPNMERFDTPVLDVKHVQSQIRQSKDSMGEETTTLFLKFTLTYLITDSMNPIY